jgi:hypothetical protein
VTVSIRYLSAVMQREAAPPPPPVPPTPTLNWAAPDAATYNVAISGVITNTGSVASGAWSINVPAGWTVSPSSGSSIAVGVPQVVSITPTVNGTGAFTLTCSGATITGNPQSVVATGAPPAWFASATVNQWYQLTGTALNAQTTDAGGVGAGIVNDYSGCVVVPADAELVAFGGGHAGYSGNEVLALRLSIDVPAWAVRVQPTPVVSREEALNGGSFNATQMWWGTAPNEKPNNCHTYDSGQYVSALDAILWFGRSSPWNYSGTPPGFNNILRLTWSTRTWVQPGSGGDLGANQGNKATTQDADGNCYTTGTQHIYKYTPGSGWTTLVNDASLNWSGLGCLLFDTTRNRMLRLGDLSSGAMPRLITLAGAVSTPTLTGDAGVLSSLNSVAGIDSLGGCYDPINDRYVVPTRTAGNFFAINASTWAVTEVTPSTVSGTVPNPAVSLGVFGRIKCMTVATKSILVYIPDGTQPVWVMRLD